MTVKNIATNDSLCIIYFDVLIKFLWWNQERYIIRIGASIVV